MDANGRKHTNNNNQTTKQTTKRANHEPNTPQTREENLCPSAVHTAKKKGEGREHRTDEQISFFHPFLPRPVHREGGEIRKREEENQHVVGKKKPE